MLGLIFHNLYHCNHHWIKNKEIAKYTGCSINENLGCMCPFFTEHPVWMKIVLESTDGHSTELFPEILFHSSKNNGAIFRALTVGTPCMLSNCEIGTGECKISMTNFVCGIDD